MLVFGRMVCFILATLFLCPSWILVAAASTTTNDPFRAIAARVVKQPEPPICCLVPPPSNDHQEDLLLSFEEWKEKRIAAGDVESGVTTLQDGTGGNGQGGINSERAGDGAGEVPSLTPADNANSKAVVSPLVADEYTPSPHFRVPITDRFNYAALDCSARVHISHKAAKSALSILSHKRDKYMLSPCREKETQFVVVELCDDIRIDTVQLANFEFFSGVFKEFTVSVAKTYTTDPEGWTFAGTYLAKNIRVVQSFHPPTTLRDFYRFIRIDFRSHYGNEYYCPVSLLRVYGLTHLEEYKWDVWQEESRARLRAVSASSASSAASTPVEVNEPEPAPAPEIRIPPSYSEYVSARESLGSKQDGPTHPNTIAIAKLLPSESNEKGQQAMRRSDSSAESRSALILETLSSASSQVSRQSNSELGTAPTLTESAKPIAPSSTDEGTTKSKIMSYSSTPSVIAISGASLTSVIKHTSTNSEPSSFESSEISSIPTPSLSSISNTAANAAPPPPNSNSNSIYRTIMNRLSALEANHTLFSQYMEEHRVYARYVEEHTAAVRELLRRVGEDIGRAEAVARAQAQKWDRQRKRVDAEQLALIKRVDYLSEEIVLEKRLGIAQLLLLLAILVFLTLTRGSPSTSIVSNANMQHSASASLRAWGKRHLSLRSFGSGSRSRRNSEDDWDWVGRLKRERSPSFVRGIKREETEQRLDKKASVEFPRLESEAKPLAIAAPTPLPAHPSILNPSTSIALPNRDDTDTPIPTSSKHKPARLNLLPVVSRQRTRSAGNSTLVLEGGVASSSGRRPSTRTAPNNVARSSHRRVSRPGTPTHIHGYYGPHPSLQTQSHSAGSFPMTHSISQDSHAGPRSARKWARTAHLHELRSPPAASAQAPLPPEVGAARVVSDLDGDETANRADSDEKDIFSSMSPFPASAGEQSSSPRSPTARWGIGMSHLHHGLAGDVLGDDGDGDGDSQWVDTDEGESEMGDELVGASSPDPQDKPLISSSPSPSGRSSSSLPWVGQVSVGA
ncbi:SUN domain-containing protein [Mycena indigotica]|uniref:SUN domain-containing protein n=1 Tax=Mycena indigotica TaxID=2126181 RepID=A0A8H6W5Y2_9AGAR|nr:SUN domain-containing protein [Mycena indigotica]KAF7304021.1 SUN domain-containing protein [Mycena indigotica]